MNCELLAIHALTVTGVIWTVADKLIVKFDTSPHSVAGVAHIDNKFYVIVDRCDRVAVIVDAPPYCRLDYIIVDGMTQPTDLATCRRLRRLFVADHDAKCVWRIDIGDKDDNAVTAVKHLDDDDDDSGGDGENKSRDLADAIVGKTTTTALCSNWIRTKVWNL